MAKRTRQSEWSGFIKQQMEAGTRFAHAITKPKSMAMVVLSGAGGAIDSPMHQLEEQEVLWSGMWRCEEQRQEWDFIEYPVPPDMPVEQIVSAAASFAPYTAQADGFHPR